MRRPELAIEGDLALRHEVGRRAGVAADDPRDRRVVPVNARRKSAGSDIAINHERSEGSNEVLDLPVVRFSNLGLWPARVPGSRTIHARKRYPDGQWGQTISAHDTLLCLRVQTYMPRKTGHFTPTVAAEVARELLVAAGMEVTSEHTQYRAVVAVADCAVWIGLTYGCSREEVGDALATPGVVEHYCASVMGASTASAYPTLVRLAWVASGLR